jgi:predicted RNA-binding protein with RPS1 domain
MQAVMSVTHVIVDGSNIATEGRDTPSLAQLDEAVQAFIEEYSPKYVTVVVDATFPNRIDRKERKTYESAVNANELITPPAGAIGRGDAFVLQIARRAGAAILSNDSFQEFHGDYPWLFEKGRLIGGKPVPHVGWVFMERAPVRGPTSRRAVSEARKVAKTTEKAAAKVAAAADGDESPAKAPRKRRTRAKADMAAAPTAGDAAETTSVPAGADAAAAVAASVTAEPSSDGRSDGGGRGGKAVEPYNEALPFIDFVAQHPVGSEVDTTIERFSSHGAYVMVGDARAYIPLRNLAHPAPRSAKEMLRVGEERRFVVVSIDPPRRGIDLAVPGLVDVPAQAPVDVAAIAEAEPELAEAVAEAGARSATPPARKAAKRTTRKKAAGEPVAEDAATEPAAEPVKKAATRKAAAKKAPAKKAAATKKSATKKAATKKAATKKAATKKAATKKAVANEAGANESRAREAAARKAGAKKSAAKKATGRAAAAGSRPEQPPEASGG